MRSIQTVVILDGASVSSSVDLGLEGNVAGILTDANWDTTGIQIEGSVDAINFFPAFDGAAVLGVSSAVASRFYMLDPHRTVAIRYLRLRSGTSAVPVNQTGNTTLTIVSGRFI